MYLERIRIKNPDGTFSVRDYTFSQACNITSVLSNEERDAFFRRELVVTKEDTDYVLAGSELKYMGEV